LKKLFTKGRKRAEPFKSGRKRGKDFLTLFFLISMRNWNTMGEEKKLDSWKKNRKRQGSGGGDREGNQKRQILFHPKVTGGWRRKADMEKMVDDGRAEEKEPVKLWGKGERKVNHFQRGKCEVGKTGAPPSLPPSVGEKGGRSMAERVTKKYGVRVGTFLLLPGKAPGGEENETSNITRLFESGTTI